MSNRMKDTLVMDAFMQAYGKEHPEGHTHGQTTVNIYAHATKSSDEKAAEIMDNIFNNSKEIKKKVYKLKRI